MSRPDSTFSVDSDDDSVDSVTAATALLGSDDGSVALVTPAADVISTRLFFGAFALWGFTTNLSPFGFGSRAFCMYGICVQTGFVVLLISFPFVYWCTNGFDTRNTISETSRELVLQTKIADMVMCVVMPGAGSCTMILMNLAFKSNEDGASSMEDLWTTQIPRGWWRKFRWSMLFFPTMAICWIAVCIVLAVFMGKYYYRCYYRWLVYIISIAWGSTAYLIGYVSANILGQQLRRVQDQFHHCKLCPDEISKLIARAHCIQKNWLSKEGHSRQGMHVCALVVGACLLLIFMDIIILATLQQKRGNSSVVELGQYASVTLFQILTLSVMLVFLLSPPLLVTRACDNLHEEVNELVGRLATTHPCEDHVMARLKQSLDLCGHFKQYMNDLNRKQGMGVLILDKLVTKGLMKKLMVFTASVLGVYWEQSLHFFQDEFHEMLNRTVNGIL
mmetsp:Transcript_136378/g.272016  ORF Transcript_136378/g.272016 Transcript_136378/m.272016 type:complete len:447 (+) Transcript_136378:87-1427(+)